MSLAVVSIGLVLLAVSALLSAAETSVMLLSPGRVHRLAESERPGAASLSRLVEHRHRLRAVSALVGGATYGVATIAGVQAARLVTPLPAFANGAGVLVVTGFGASVGVIVAVAVVFALGQALPRTMAATNPERIALDAAPLVLPIIRVVYPAAALLGTPWKWAVDVIGAERTLPPWAVSAEWRGVGAEEDGDRDVAEEAILEAVSDFAEKIAREVMVPRTDMAALPDTATAADAVALIAETGFSRIPVYHDSVDDVRAVLYAKDLLRALSEGGGTAVRAVDLARKAYFVPETKPVEELLVEMRTQTHIAIVADEYGGTAGLVTLEDLLEEIVGEISDEYDREEVLLVDLGEGRYRVDARLPVDDLNEAFDTDIETDADSVGGLFTELAGRIPDVGESIEIEGLRVTVTDLEGTRVRQLMVEPAASATEGAEGA